MTVDITLPVDQEYIRSFSKELGENEWLTTMRLKALESAAELPMPRPDKTKIDKWNFTQFQHHYVKSDAFTSLDEVPEEVKALINLNDQHNNLYIQRNNTPAFLAISNELKEKGVIFTDIITAAKEHSDLVKKFFMTEAVTVEENKLTALHTALMNGGIFLFVPKGVVLEKPIQSIFLHDQNDATFFNHVLVVAEENSSVTYVENYLSTTGETEGIANIIVEVIAGNNAKVAFGAVDHLSSGITTYVNRRGVAKRDARIEWALGQMNDGDTISENETTLLGDGSFADTKTVVVGRGKQTQNFTTRVVQFGKNTEGYILKHGVMKDEATSIFNGIGKIEHGASKANAEQESRVLMLSEKARGDANPILLIDEDDVTAGHAASVGRVDPVQLYYLMSRGIPQKEAERLVIHGFLAPVVNQIPIEAVKKQLTEVIERKVR
ncbi:Fe-S cluster assembly protein SufD [Oikeobacillus pervagus]|uniref:Fe-S cluster assembly protein SufD n=1 Tax=Oikeobacillus pervagus TaxID=1325931 RepID=A0AAJ1SYU8_9BACI|nr:Fe-S cluster assembly protein SufD [Oikeobacillus pervagus]MDQ0215144.1 Fe-S cluster assembly protein SufD [Oikeobacillus pervagus]